MKRKREERRRIRRLKIKTLFMLSLTLIFNTYAWFLYVTEVSTNMTVHVDAWNVAFVVGEQTIEKEYLFDIEHAYPGMDEVERIVTITNAGDKNAKLSYKMVMLRVLDETYVVESELTAEEKAALTGEETKITQEQMQTLMREGYPFKINIISDTEILNIKETGNVTMTFSWAFDSGNDELDTQYGVDSYKYYEENSGKSAIQAKIKLKAEQNKE